MFNHSLRCSMNDVPFNIYSRVIVFSLSDMVILLDINWTRVKLTWNDGVSKSLNDNSASFCPSAINRFLTLLTKDKNYHWVYIFNSPPTTHIWAGKNLLVFNMNIPAAFMAFSSGHQPVLIINVIYRRKFDYFDINMYYCLTFNSQHEAI